MKSIIQVLIAVVLLILLIRVSEPTKKPQNNPIPEGGTSILNDNPSIEPSPQEEVFQFSSLLDLHNSVRKNPLIVDSDLSKFAQNWAEHMKNKDKLDHSKLNFPGEWKYKGENIAYGYETEESVFETWMKSKGHKRNIKNEEFTYIGIGKSGSYWCVCFGEKQLETTYWWEFWK